MSIENFDCQTDQTQLKSIEQIGRIDRTQSNWSIQVIDQIIESNRTFTCFFGWLVLIDFDWFDQSVRLIRLVSPIEFDWFDWSVRLIWSISSIDSIDQFDWLDRSVQLTRSISLIDSIDQFDWVRLISLSIIEIFDCLRLSSRFLLEDLSQSIEPDQSQSKWLIGRSKTIEPNRKFSFFFQL